MFRRHPVNQLHEMLARYFKKGDNPWELLAIALWFFGPGLALVLYNGPALFLRHRTRASFTPVGVHLFGWWAIAIGVAFAALYFYARRMNPSEPKSPPLVTVANCYDLGEAYRLQMALGVADIPSFIPDEATAQNAPYLFVGSEAGVRLQVPEEHMVEAQQVIEDARPKASHDDNASDHEEKEQRF